MTLDQARQEIMQLKMRLSVLETFISQPAKRRPRKKRSYIRQIDRELERKPITV